MSVIYVHNLQKTYRTQRGEPYKALVDVDFSVERGELISVVGPSGCGKSTLVKVIAGLIPYTSGEVAIDDKPVTGPSRRVGVVFQDPLLLEWRTVVGNIMMPIQVLKLPRRKYELRCRELLDMTGLSEFADNYPWELSGGMQQRVAICRALVFDPEILLMDEPFGALDAMTRDYMNLELLRIWIQSGKTIVLITHSITEAVFLSDRVYVMSASPGTIRDVIEVRLPRPRILDMTSTQEFGNYTARVRRHFTDMFGLHADSDGSVKPLGARRTSA